MLTGLLTILLLCWLARIIKGIRNYRSLLIPTLGPWSERDGPPARVSICVPARDEAKNLRVTLPRFLGQDYPDYEVIIVNDRSEDETAELLAVHDDARLP